MIRLMERARRLARTSAAVLITGESGSGKEVVAQAVHLHSSRSKGPWVDVSCAALPESLIESELFGYERGAFSGADRAKAGLFEMAHQGTLFLDEIGELPFSLQSKLLRVLDGNGFLRLGGTRRVEADVRIVAATNADLEGMARRGEFRFDLYQRLAQVCVMVPPLRERKQDIEPLAGHFLKQYAPGIGLSASALEILHSYAWPGNVRELRNALIGASVEAEGDRIEVCHLPRAVRSPSMEVDLMGLAASLAPLPLLEQKERETILGVLQANGGHQERTARALGISSRTINRKLKRYQVKVNVEK